MLYQMLTRRLPHQGALAEVLRAKQENDAPLPSALAPETPADLDQLCSALLQRDPRRRPSTEAMRALCRDWPSLGPAEHKASAISAPGITSFVGRREVLARLETLYRGTRAGGPLLAMLRAESGMGKTKLLGSFIEHLQRVDDVFVLRGRCYEREAVPYKAFDEIFDDLTRILLRLADEQAAQLVPRHVQTLVRLFPVLLRVGVFKQAASGTAPLPAEAHLQRLGFAAVRELLCRIADRRPLVLVIDDLQWADVDSIRLLSEILAPPEPPNVFIVGSHRAEEDESAIVRELLGLSHVACERVELGPLHHHEAVELALSALPLELAEREREAELLADESRGIPLYVLELARARRHGRHSGEPTSLLELIQRRVSGLPAEARTILELAALTGRPLPREVLLQACDPVAYPAALSALRAAKLVHSGGNAPDEAIEPYHDRVREAVLATLGAGTARAHHGALARALETTRGADPEWLAQHLRGAGELDKAHHYVVQAARLAMEALAFNRAADLYDLALELTDRASPLPTVQRELGDALARAGRGARAADAYLEAARHAPRVEALELEGLAASQWLRVGHLDQAVRLLQAVLERNDLRWPESTLESVARLLFNRARIRASGLKFVVRSEEQVPRHLLDKLDALYPAQTALGTFDYLRGACFATTALPLALEAGEPRRLVTALASEAVYSVMLDGLKGTDRAGRIRDSIDTVSAGMSDPYGIGVAQLTAALCGYWGGQWNRVIDPSLRAEELFTQRVPGGTWEVTLVRSVRHTVLIHAGGLPALSEEVPGALLDASERCDRYAEFDLMRSMTTVQLRNDRPEEALHMLERMRGQLERFPLVSLNHLMLSANVATYLYAGQIARARQVLDALWEECRKVALHRFPLIRLNYLGMRADCVRADTQRSASARAAELGTLAKQAASESVAWARALAQHIEGAARALKRDGSGAAKAFERANEAYLASGMPLDAALARLEQAAHAPPLRAQELRADALGYLTGQGVARAECWARMVHSIY
jgi:tetratricopeptide (TPR) repeat protein